MKTDADHADHASAAKAVGRRLQETVELRTKLDLFLAQAELSAAQFPELRQFAEDCNAFVREGRSISARVRCRDLKRVFVYRLSTQPHVRSTLDILYRPRD